ncbi:DUF4007 family protein [Herbaspirillum sp. RTI4]|uniref:DUF4007 family protein n=1 Tax=Herbaspirillum sp. RTI4 TaxID=3048640 RepID=UPI002AB3AF34|nr:DUF4007 family protein [Herbaspirillum sp. RTI4]MDY7577261.1 DUF4007 family protein [Herbaspirillum sp. RTI4]MEA9980551.1 DUF4007 family protein [Herbaspirillum sp. RTI4]
MSKVLTNLQPADFNQPLEKASRFRFSGHQSFSLRIAWLPKAIKEISKGHDPLTDIDLGITSMGLGKNMVESLRCWIEAFQVATKEGSDWKLTQIGELIFSPKTGQDPYLEDHTSNWLLHWLICSNTSYTLFAWECLFNRWPTTEFSAAEVMTAFRREFEKNNREASPVTLKQHWEVFLHSYRPPRGGKGEDHLDSALSALGLIREVGERQNSQGKWEPLYSFDIGQKASIPQQLFAFFIHDWWNRKFPAEKTVSLQEIVSGEHSPGRLLKLQEKELLLRIENLAHIYPKVFKLTESANVRLLQRPTTQSGYEALITAYTNPIFL